MQHPPHQKNQRCGQVEFYLTTTTKMLVLWHREELGEELHVICLDMQLEDQMARWGVYFSFQFLSCLQQLVIMGQHNSNKLKVIL